MGVFGLVGRGAVILAGMGLAEAALAAGDADFNIPRGDLGAVVTSIAAAGGTPIVFPGDITVGKQAGPIVGHKTVRQALDQALAGSGLVVSAGPRGLTIVRKTPIATAQGGADLDIPDVDITQDLNGDHGFQAGDSGATTRVSAPLKEIPLSVNVVTDAVIKAQNDTSVAQAAQNVSGVQVQNGNNGTPVYFVRGFQVTGSPSINGVTTAPQTSVPITDVERIEVLKGPTSILSGSTNTGGGLVNVTTKAPTETPIRDVTAYYGKYNYKTLAFDLGGPVPQTEGLTYRFNLSGNTVDKNYAGYTNGHEHLISPSIRWQDDKTSVLFGIRYTDTKTLPGAFTSVRNVPGNYATYYEIAPHFYGGPTANQAVKNLNLYSELSRKLFVFDGYEVAVHSNNGFTRTLLNQNYYSQIGSSNNFLTIRPAYNRFDYDTFDSKNDLTIKKDYGFLRNLSRFGLDYNTFYSTTASGANTALTTQYNILTGTPIVPLYNNVAASQLTANTTTDVGYSYLDKIDTFNDRLHILGTVRNDYFANRTAIASAGPSANSGFYKTSYTAGAAFDLLSWATIYGSKADGFFAQNVIDYQGNPILPQGRDQTEFGVKYAFLDRRLSVTTSVFSLAATNVPVSLATLPGDSITAIAGQTTKGAELDVQGQIFTGLNVIGSFSYQDGLNQDPRLFTLIIAGVPHYTASIFGTYTFSEGLLAGFSFGGGAQGQGGSFVTRAARAVNNYTTTTEVPGYVIGNLVAGYKYKNYDMNLRVSNITNAYYTTNTSAGSNLPIGEGRSFVFTATAHL